MGRVIWELGLIFYYHEYNKLISFQKAPELIPGITIILDGGLSINVAQKHALAMIFHVCEQKMFYAV